MSEFTGLAYYAEIPIVIFNVQRTGPSTGLPTRTMQGDITSTAFLSHGDTSHLLLFPYSVGECYEMAQEAFDLAEQFGVDLDGGLARRHLHGRRLTEEIRQRIDEPDGKRHQDHKVFPERIAIHLAWMAVRRPVSDAGVGADS